MSNDKELIFDSSFYDQKADNERLNSRLFWAGLCDKQADEAREKAKLTVEKEDTFESPRAFAIQLSRHVRWAQFKSDSADELRNIYETEKEEFIAKYGEQPKAPRSASASAGVSDASNDKATAMAEFKAMMATQ